MWVTSSAGHPPYMCSGGGGNLVCNSSSEAVGEKGNSLASVSLLALLDQKLSFLGCVWVAQSVKQQNLDFTSGYDRRV